MRNIKLEIEYDGTNYCGWQVQRRTKDEGRRTKTIQETIGNALQKILQEKIKLIASGRTDAGVHALAQVANFKTNSTIPLKNLQRALNGLLPEDITISKVEEKGVAFHSRFKAKSKLYRYSILNRPYPSALLRNRVYFYPYPLDLRIMRKAAGDLVGTHNFRSFQTRADIPGKNKRNTVRTIRKIKLVKQKDLIYIDIEADGFLYNMVRNIVGTLIEIGRGKLKQDYLKQILYRKDRRFSGPTVPAKGLCLMRVKY